MNPTIMVYIRILGVIKDDRFVFTRALIVRPVPLDPERPWLRGPEELSQTASISSFCVGVFGRIIFNVCYFAEQLADADFESYSA